MKARCRVAGPGASGLGEGERGPLLVGVEVDGGGGEGVAAVGIGIVQLGEGDLQLGGVEGDRGGGLLDGHVDLDVTGEGGGAEVRGEHEPVGVGQDRGREPVGGRVSSVRGAVSRSAHAGQATVGPCTLTTFDTFPTILRPDRRFDAHARRRRRRRLPRLDVVAIGNALVDVLASATDEDLAALDLVKGTMVLVDQERSAVHLRPRWEPTTEASGGSAANTAAGVAALGGRAAFLGRVADDALGQAFTHDIRSVGVAFDPTPDAGRARARW